MHNSHSTLRPYYLMVTFWGQKYREFFYSLCLPSLLSPNNLPVLREVRGSKLIICTTKEDWDALKNRPLFEVLKTCVEPFFLEIGFPGPEEPIQLHMSKGHVLAARMAWEDRAYGGFLAPDLLVSDGMIAKVIDIAAKGARAVLAPALRYAMEPVVEKLESSGFMKKDVPMNLEPRWLAGLGIKSLHSEILRYDFESPFFGNYPIWCYWRVPNRDCIVLHTVSWALLLGSYEHITHYTDKFLENSTIDGFYVFNNFFHFRDAGAMHLITDSDDLMFMSLTPESEFTFFPLMERKINSIPDVGFENRLYEIGKFHSSSVLDPFRRWAYTIPFTIHGDSLCQESDLVVKKAVSIVEAALSKRRRIRTVTIHFVIRFLEILKRVPRKMLEWVSDPKKFYAFMRTNVDNRICTLLTNGFRIFLDWPFVPVFMAMPISLKRVIAGYLPERLLYPLLRRVPQKVMEEMGYLSSQPQTMVKGNSVQEGEK